MYTVFRALAWLMAVLHNAGAVPEAGLHLLSEDACARVGGPATFSVGIQGVLAEPESIPWGCHHCNSYGEPTDAPCVA